MVLPERGSLKLEHKIRGLVEQNFVEDSQFGLGGKAILIKTYAPFLNKFVGVITAGQGGGVPFLLLQQVLEDAVDVLLKVVAGLIHDLLEIR